MLKRLYLLIILVPVVVSCLQKSTYRMSGPLNVDFELDGVDFGEDSVYFESAVSAGNILYFANKVEGGNFGGFALSIAKNRTDEYGPYSVYDSDAAYGSDGFLLFRNTPSLMPEHHIIFMQPDYGTCSPVLCMVHNTTLVAKTILEGENKFERDDWLKLTATGYAGDTVTGTAEIYLADYREKDSLITTWTAFDLQKLGNIEYIDFSLSSSKPDGVVPEYFCMDNFYANIDISY